MANLLSDDAHRRMSKAVRWVEGQRTRWGLSETSQITQVPRSGEQAFVLCRVVQEIGEGFYKLEQVILANTILDATFTWRHNDALRELDCPDNEAMEINQRRGIANGRLVYAQPMGQDDDAASSEYTRKSKWVFDVDDDRGDFTGFIYWEANGDRKLHINSGHVRIAGSNEIFIGAVDTGVNIGELSNCAAEDEGGISKYYYVEIDITYGKKTPFWNFDVNQTLQSSVNEPDVWIEKGNPQRTEITWNIIIGVINNETWEPYHVGAISHHGFVPWNLIANYQPDKRQVIVQENGCVQWELECCEPPIVSPSQSPSVPPSPSVSSPPCEFVCVEDAGSTDANQTYQLVAGCSWQGQDDPTWTIEKVGDTFHIRLAAITIYESQSFNADDCPCPSEQNPYILIEPGGLFPPTVTEGECASVSVVPSESTIPACGRICVDGAGLSEVDGTYELFDGIDCVWVLQDDTFIKIILVDLGFGEVYELQINGTAVYTTKVTEAITPCDCPSNFTWFKAQIGAGTVPTFTQGICESASVFFPSPDPSAPPCETVCVSGGGDPFFDGSYDRDSDCKWTKQSDSSLVIERVGNQFLMKTSGTPIYQTNTFPLGDCPCPADLTWSIEPGQEASLPVPDVDEGQCISPSPSPSDCLGKYLHWQLNESVGATIAIDIIDSNPGTITGAVMGGGSAIFDGVDDEICAVLCKPIVGDFTATMLVSFVDTDVTTTSRFFTIGGIELYWNFVIEEFHLNGGTGGVSAGDKCSLSGTNYGTGTPFTITVVRLGTNLKISAGATLEFDETVTVPSLGGVCIASNSGGNFLPCTISDFKIIL